MKLFLTATSERGKPVTKSGNDYINMEIIDENREKIADITIQKGTIDIYYQSEKYRLATLASEDIPN